MNLSKTISFSRILRLHALKMTSNAGSSHIGSMFSIADIVAVLFLNILKIYPKDPKNINRDRFVLSKGHAGGIVYAALAERGFFPLKNLSNYCKNGKFLSGHISHHNVPGVEISTGSLGHGLSICCGISYALKKKNIHIFNLMSDGECDEGSIWEASLFAAHHNLHNLINIIDYNKLQSIREVKLTLKLEPLKKKWESFGWNVIEVDGHSHKSLFEVFLKAKKNKNKPTCIIAHTTKGKGVNFMENSNLWHYRTAQNREFDEAMKQLLNKKK